MLIAHLADLHLGYRAYNKTIAGVNVRERDVVLAFREAIDRIIELRPQLVLVAGDVFHSPRPTNSVVREAFRQFGKLHVMLPGTNTIMIAGNHDMPKTVEVGNPLEIFKEIPNVNVVERGDAVYWPGYPIIVDVYAWDTPHLAPDGYGPDGICVWHGDPPPINYGNNRGYVAMGHYHIREEVAPNVWYSGSIERTSNNIWAEVTPKGFQTYDTDTKEVVFYPVKTRPVIDLPRILHANERTADEVNGLINMLVESCEPDDKIVRLVIEDCARDLAKALDHSKIREFRGRALHFQLETRAPKYVRRALTKSAGKTIEQEAEEFIRNDYTVSSPDIDKEKVVGLMKHYMTLATAHEHERE